MIIHTVISPADIFYKEPKQVNKKTTEEFSTNPYLYLDKDYYYKKYKELYRLR